MTEERVLVFVFTLDPSPWSYPPPVSFPSSLPRASAGVSFLPKEKQSGAEAIGSGPTLGPAVPQLHKTKSL